MPSLQDSALIFILALLLFGPKKLPVLARELGKWIGEFRRASNEFKMQMEEELRLSEQAERQEKLAAIEAAAPASPVIDGVPTEEPEHPHTTHYDYGDPREDGYVSPDPVPIATSGDLNIMPPSTGLPVAQTSSSSDIGPLIESIPVVETASTENSIGGISQSPISPEETYPVDAAATELPHQDKPATESAAHG